jgi:putative flippase GtrA
MAFVFANIGAYFLNTIFTFKEKPSVRSFLKFPVVSIAQLLINYLVPAAFVYWSIEYVFFVPILSTVICLPLVFLLTKFAIKGSVVSRKNQ